MSAERPHIFLENLMSACGETQASLAGVVPGMTQDRLSKSLRGFRRFQPDEGFAIVRHFQHAHGVSQDKVRGLLADLFPGQAGFDDLEEIYRLAVEGVRGVTARPDARGVPPMAERDYVAIPYLKIEGSSGRGVEVADEARGAPVVLQRDFAREIAAGDVSGVFGLKNHGQSNTPRLNHNDLVLIDTKQKNIAGGRIFAVRVGGELFFKRVIPDGPERLILRSENPDYDDVPVPREEVEIIGRVIWVGQIL